MNLGAISTLVFDLDGVVWRGDAPIESAITAINQLREAGKRCLYCTNNSSQTQATFAAKLTGMGIEGVVEDDIITSSVATATYLSAQFTGPFLAYVVGGEGIRLALQKIGARIVPDADINGDTQVDCVIVGIDRAFNYEKMDIAQRLIRRGALFVATNRDATYPMENGVIPGSGAIVAAVETAAGSPPVTVGKPRPVMLQLVMQQYDLQAEQMAFIGDRLDTDIVCARRAGVPALLVTTGVTTLAEARRAKGEMRPDAVFPDLLSLKDVLLGNAPSQVPAAATVAAGAIAIEDASTTAEAGVVPESLPLVEEAPAEPELVLEPETAVEAETSIETEAAPDAEAAFAMDEAPAFSLDSETMASQDVAPETATEGVVETSFAGISDSATPSLESSNLEVTNSESLDLGSPDDEFSILETASGGEEDLLAAPLPASDVATDEWDDTWFADAEAKAAAGESAEGATADDAADEITIVTDANEDGAVASGEGAKTEDETPAPASGNFDWKLD